MIEQLLAEPTLEQRREYVAARLRVVTARWEAAYGHAFEYTLDQIEDEIAWLRRAQDALQSEASWLQWCMERKVALKLGQRNEPDFSTGSLRAAYARELQDSRAAYACLNRCMFRDDEQQRARVQSRRVREWIRESLTKEKHK